MRYKPALRLALKVLGLFLLIEALCSLIVQVTVFIQFAYTTPGAMGLFRTSFGTIPSIVVKGAIAAYLLFGGRWVVDKLVPPDRPYCPQCAYDLTGATSQRCPECGTPFSCDAVRPGQP